MKPKPRSRMILVMVPVATSSPWLLPELPEHAHGPFEKAGRPRGARHEWVEAGVEPITRLRAAAGIRIRLGVGLAPGRQHGTAFRGAHDHAPLEEPMALADDAVSLLVELEPEAARLLER